MLTSTVWNEAQTTIQYNSHAHVLCHHFDFIAKKLYDDNLLINRYLDIIFFSSHCCPCILKYSLTWTIWGKRRAKLFLQEVLEAYSSKYMSASRMLGDQLALAWVVKSHPSFDASRFSKALPFTENIGGTSILFLPCALYNWTPPEGAGQFHGMPLDVKVQYNLLPSIDL